MERERGGGGGVEVVRREGGDIQKYRQSSRSKEDRQTNKDTFTNRERERGRERKGADRQTN